MKITENKFIELLRKSDTFVLREAISKVKNAKVLAVFSKVKDDENSLIFQDPKTNKIYYADYTLTEDMIEFGNIENIEFVNKDYKKDLRENIENLFSKDYESNFQTLSSTIKDIINENDEAEVRIGRKIKDLMKEEVVLHVDKPKYELKDKSKLKENIEKLRSDAFFGKFLVEAENKNKTPVILEEIDWTKTEGKIFRKKINFKTQEPITESKYTKRGFLKTAILAKEYWKDEKFRKRISDFLSEEGESEKKSKVFCEMYKNITLLEREDLNEMLSKTLLAVFGNAEISDKLQKVYEAIDSNKESMLHWKLLQEQPPMAADPMPAPGTPAGDVPPEAADVSDVAPGGEEAAAEDPAGVDVTPDELPMAGEDEEVTDELATEATEEVKIINALLDVVEDVFWNGNQENKELANLIKEIRDMRTSGTFDEERLSEIFRDLFAVTQEISTSPVEESPTGEELPPEEEMGMEEPGMEGEMPAEAPEAPGGPGAGEATPLETYA